MKKWICKLTKHNWKVFPKYFVMFDPPEPWYYCTTCGIEEEVPDREDMTAFGWLHRLIALPEHYYWRWRNRDIPF